MQLTSKRRGRPRWQNAAFLVASAVAMSMSAVAPAHADLAGVLNNVITMLNGTVAKSLAILAVMLTGFAWMFGHLDMRKAGMVIFGIALVFGATEIVGTISGQ